MKRVNRKYLWALLPIILVAIAGCNKRSQLVYLSNVNIENLATQKAPDYYLRPGDVLYVQILTRDQNTNNLFNNRGISGSGAFNLFDSDASMYLYGYSVSDSGKIHLPVFGLIPVSGLTVGKAHELIQRETQKYITDGIAVVKLLSFKITVLGEVTRPGVYANYKENISIFEGIGLAGDLTSYAERDKVLLLRQTPEGVKTIRVNLQDKNIIGSEAFYLVPNDMIIIEPRKGKVFAMNSPNISIYLSIVSTMMLVMNIVLK